MTQSQNGEAMTPSDQPQTIASLVGEVVHAFVAHGFNTERTLEQADQGARNLGLQLRLAHKAVDERERHITELQDRLDRLEGISENAFALVGAAFSQGSLPITPEWQDAASAWADQFSAACPGWTASLTDGLPLPYMYLRPVQTDAEPTEGVNPTCTKGGHLASSCEHVQQRQTEGMPMPEEPEHYDDGTMLRVLEALRTAGLSDVKAANAINEMQNEGILFRERAEPTCKCPRGEDGLLVCEHAPDGVVHPAIPDSDS